MNAQKPVHLTSQEMPIDQSGAAKKPYAKPAFRFERVFETRALTCGKQQDTQHSCHHNRRSS